MANKNIGLLGLLGIPVIIGYMYWVKQSNIKEFENDIRNTNYFNMYDTGYESNLDKDKYKSRLNKEKNNYLPSTLFPIGLYEKISNNVSDFYNSNIKAPYKHMSSKKTKHNVGGSSSKNRKTKTKKHRKN
jgi:hypothetical protein